MFEKVYLSTGRILRMIVEKIVERDIIRYLINGKLPIEHFNISLNIGFRFYF